MQFLTYGNNMTGLINTGLLYFWHLHIEFKLTSSTHKVDYQKNKTVYRTIKIEN